MKRLVIIVEGESEEEFVNRILRPYFNAHAIFNVESFKIKHSKGGLTNYKHLKKDILNTIYESGAIVTTLIDFYALPKDFPKYTESQKIANKPERLDFLEQAILDDLESTQAKTFSNLLPYIQLHEFEAFVFCSPQGVSALFERNEADFVGLEKIVKAFPNPEDINDDPNTAPSKRLLKLIPGYSKVIDGILIIDEIGIEKVIESCPRFRNWLERLIAVMEDESPV